MKKIFERLGLGLLICLSFIYTERAAGVLIEKDEIMKEIHKHKKTCELKPIDAIVNENTIIPGINGYEVNELESYHKLKKVGFYNKELLKYKTIKPKNSLFNNYNKYIISGNQTKNGVSILFKVEKNLKIDEILNILTKKGIVATFFIDSIWLENNNELVLSLIKEGHTIGNLSYNFDYQHNDFIWIDTIIKKVGHQQQGYCYNEQEDKQALEICSINKNYTIRPSIIVKNYPTLEVKEELKSGSIISFPINGIVINELNYIIDNIYSKGLKIMSLPELLSE